MYIRVYLGPLETTSAFPYLGRTVDFNNSDWSDLYRNMRKAQWWWGVVGKVLTKTGETAQAWAMIYKVVVKTVILYGSEGWVVMDVMIKVLEENHH